MATDDGEAVFTDGGNVAGVFAEAQRLADLQRCHHALVSPDDGRWWCETCGQQFAPIFATIKEAMRDAPVAHALSRTESDDRSEALGPDSAA